MSKLKKNIPAWHAEAAAELNKDFTEIEAMQLTARRRRAYLGLKFIYIKEKGKADKSIPHGHFGDWLKKHCAAIPRPTIGDYITEAKSICERMGWQISGIQNFEVAPHKLLEMPADQLKPTEKAEQLTLFELTAGEGKFRAVTEYKQVAEGSDVGEQYNKLGREKGCAGNTKDQRAKAKEVTDLERLTALHAFTEKVDAWLLENCHLNGFPRLDEVGGGTGALAKFTDTIAQTHQFLTNLKKARKQ